MERGQVVLDGFPFIIDRLLLMKNVENFAGFSFPFYFQPVVTRNSSASDMFSAELFCITSIHSFNIGTISDALEIFFQRKL